MTMTIGQSPPKKIALLVHGRGRVAIVNQGVGVGAGSEGRTSRRESINFGTFSADNYYCHPPSYCRSTLFRPFRAAELVFKANVVLYEFSGSGSATIHYCHPSLYLRYGNVRKSNRKSDGD